MDTGAKGHLVRILSGKVLVYAYIIIVLTASFILQLADKYHWF